MPDERDRCRQQRIYWEYCAAYGRRTGGSAVAPQLVATQTKSGLAFDAAPAIRRTTASRRADGLSEFATHAAQACSARALPVECPRMGNCLGPEETGVQSTARSRCVPGRGAWFGSPLLRAEGGRLYGAVDGRVSLTARVAGDQSVW